MISRYPAALGILAMLLVLCCFQACKSVQTPIPPEAASRPTYTVISSGSPSRITDTGSETDSVSLEIRKVLDEFRLTDNTAYKILEIRQTTLKSMIRIYEIDLENPESAQRLTLVYDTAFRKYQIVTYRGQYYKYKNLY